MWIAVSGMHDIIQVTSKLKIRRFHYFLEGRMSFQRGNRGRSTYDKDHKGAVQDMKITKISLLVHPF